MKHRDPRPVSGDDLGTLALVSGICMLPSAPGDSYDQVRLRNALKALSGLLAAAATTLRGRRGSQPSRCPRLLFILLLFSPTERSGAGLDAHPLQPPAVQLPVVGPSSPEAQPQEPGSIDLQPVDSWKPRSNSQEKKTVPWEGLFSFSNKWSLKVWGHLPNLKRRLWTWLF